MPVSVSTHYKIEIQFQKGAAVAVPNNVVANDGDTLEIFSNDGIFRAKFKPWPFAEPANPNNEVANSGSLTFKNDGPNDRPFELECYITPTGSNVEVAYAKGSGADGRVRPPGTS